MSNTIAPASGRAGGSVIVMTDDLPEVARLARDLIRFDTTNYGEGRAHGEREAAEYVGAYLEALGLEVEYYEPIPRRTNVVARIAGRDREKPAAEQFVEPVEADESSSSESASAVETP